MADEVKTIWCGNLSEKVSEELLYELFLQVAPLEKVRIPTDKDGRKSNFAFVTMKHEISVDYVVQMLNGTSLYNKRLQIRPRSSNSQYRNQRNEPGLNHSMMNNFKDLMAMGQMMMVYNQSHSHDHPNERRRDYFNKPYNRNPHHNKNENYQRREYRNTNHRSSHHNNNDRSRRQKNYY